jgi:superfamily II DNA or RNA helicase
MPAVHAFLDAHRCVVVFDEAHHAVARTWREVLQVARETTADAVIGLTATPTRMADSERRVLADLFEQTIAEVGSAELVSKGYLAEARPSSVQTQVDVESMADAADFEHLRTYHEMSARLADALADNVPRNRIIVETYLKGPADIDDDSFGQTIVFAVNVDHAHVLAKDFARAGCPAGALTAAMSTLYRPGDADGDVAEEVTDRETLLQAFKDSEIPVLVNVQVLTEGVDVPSAKTAFLARPTGSEVLMSQ